jgi:putative transposase
MPHNCLDRGGRVIRNINESAADFLKEALEEILTLHRLKVPALLRKTLTSTNPIEHMFSRVRDCKGNLKRYRGSAMSQRWPALILLHCVQRFHRIKGYAALAALIVSIDKEQEDQVSAAA